MGERFPSALYQRMNKTEYSIMWADFLKKKSTKKTLFEGMSGCEEKIKISIIQMIAGMNFTNLDCIGIF